ncbi:MULTISPECIES: hypothetical protein [Streptomyces]|uniref:Uncharacterized protein n=1 Tax=Streptomyces noboritoensis TaxID=67337 RepID=A0ABV6TWT9_9ACTN
MKLRSESTVEHRNTTAQVTLNDQRDEAVVIPGTCCCSAAVAR